jgi:signal transduction histidine kinase
MNYLTAFWLATGIYSNFRVLYSSLLLHAVSWLLLPVFLHLHWVVPSPLTARRSKYAVWALYLGSILLASYELLLNPAQYFYTISIFLIAFGSIGLLIYRIANKTTSPADKVAARLMLTGIGLAFVPGIVIWMIPTLLNIAPPGVLATSVVMLALPLLPLFYTYAVFKRRLGVFEVRLNQLIAVYTLFIVYLVILSIALFFRASIPTPTNLVFAFYLLVIFAIALAIIPIQDLLRRRINRLAYGSEFNPDDLYRVYAYEIPASVDRNALISLLKTEILPPLDIHQSALYVREKTDYIPVYADGLDLDQYTLGVKELAALTVSAGKYHPPIIEGDHEQDAFPDWVRLSLSLERRSETIGLWLFGKRDPDDFYAQKDINLLSDLSRQVSIAVENMRLLETVQNELAERKRAEEALKNYADRLELLHEIDRAILEVGSSEEIAQAALNGLQKLIPFSKGSVVYYDADPEEAELLAVSGLGSVESMPEHRILMGLPQVREFLENGDAWLVDDIILQSAAAPLPQVFTEGGIRALLCAPLTASGELIGSLNLGSEHGAGFDLEHRDIAIEVADSLAIAIHSARLLETVTSHSIELQRLSARLISVQEEERKYISYELHDEIGQVLTAITYNLAAIRRNIPEPISAKAADRLSDSEELVHQVMERIRDMSLKLRPSMLQDLGLIPTLRWYINQYGERMNLNVEFSADSIECPIHESTETALYRFVQEGLTNAARHAQASNITVSLECEGEILQATVRDDGIGFNPDGSDDIRASLEGTGLLGIRERLAPFGGQLRIESVIGQGTTLQARIPIGEHDEED